MLCGRLPFETRRSGSMATGGKGVAAAGTLPSG
jgi:hypothetical protein